MIHPHIFNGETLYLIQPQSIACKWNKDNLMFRSSVWDENGDPVSLAFPKFTNWNENPELFPLPKSISDTVITEKIDGSLLIVSKYKNNYILRTRGTLDASTMENGYELELFREKYLSKLDKLCNSLKTWPMSFLFEWTSPANRIVIHYGKEPNWVLVGIVIHLTYSLVGQESLDEWAKKIGCDRPEKIKADSLTELLKQVEKWEQKEGVVVYSNHGQTLHKLKSSWYLIRHRLKEEFSSFEKILDFYIQEKCPSFDDFKHLIETVVDYETACEIVGDISRCVDAHKEVNNILSGMYYFVATTLRPLGDSADKKIRGLMAKKVLESYSTTNRSGMIFKLLDGKSLDNNDLKRLFYQVLKK